VAALAEPVARRLGWGPERIAVLRHAAPLHDVGKVVVRAEVLLKPGPLSPEERAEMRTHPRAGASLVLPLRNARHLLPYVLLHHERWDGKGYPCGLAGESIPIEARLLAVADAFDAMTSARPYRAMRPREDAFAELGREAGRQFDPAVVEAFLAVWQGAAFAAA
jgi:HD-GYP domain-containing protein (c-di-GMP phosphodiesterase class II)